MQRTRKNAIYFLLGILLTLFLIDRGLKIFLPIPETAPIFPGYTIAEFQKLKVETIPPGSIVLIGDSSLGYSVDAAVLTDSLGMECHNLALIAPFTVMGDYYMIEYLLRRVQPRAIIISHAFSTFHWADPTGVQKQYLLRIFDEDPNTLQSYMIRHCYISRNQSILKKLFFTHRGGLNKNAARAYRDLLNPEDWKITYAQHDFLPQSEKLVVPDNLRFEKFKPHSFHFLDEWLSRCADLCETNNVELYVMFSPVLENWFTSNEDFAKSTRDHLLALSKDHSFVFLPLNDPMFPPQYTGDSYIHLDPDLKKYYSAWLGSILKHSPLLDSSLESYSSALKETPLKWPAQQVQN